MRSIDCLLRLFEYVSRSSFCFGIRLYTTDFSQEHLFEKSLHYIRKKPFFLIHRPGTNVLFVFTIRLHIVYSMFIDIARAMCYTYGVAREKHKPHSRADEVGKHKVLNRLFIDNLIRKSIVGKRLFIRDLDRARNT